MTAMDDGMCFAVMPFGDKLNIDGETVKAIRQSVEKGSPLPKETIAPIDFDRVYRKIIQPAAAASGLTCVRCDEIQGAGSIHEDMFRHIRAAGVVVVDISTLNANVFYELGVRHALRRKVTVLIRRKGTVAPFNIQGHRIITYDETAPEGIRTAIEEISSFIRAGRAGDDSDSPIYKHMPLLRVAIAAVPPEQRILEETAFVNYTVVTRPSLVVGFVTGDIAKVQNIDVWVNSENVGMQMARFHDPSISGAIRWLGARKNPITQQVQEDTIANELAAALEGASQVDPGAVIPTDPGALRESNGVKRIYHAAAVTGQPRRGYRPIPDVGACVNNALALLDRESAKYELTSIAFPLLGSGAGGRAFPEVISSLVRQILAYLDETPHTEARRIYLLAPIREILDEGKKIFDAIPGLRKVAT